MSAQHHAHAIALALSDKFDIGEAYLGEFEPVSLAEIEDVIQPLLQTIIDEVIDGP